MQALFALSLAVLVLSSLFIGKAFSDGYDPYATIFSMLFYFVALFVPFLGEYSVIHRSFAAMGKNFKKIIGTDRQLEYKGQMEIISPSAQRKKADGYHLNHQTRPHIPFIFFLVVGSTIFTIDAVNFFFIWDGAPPGGPISNF